MTRVAQQKLACSQVGLPKNHRSGCGPGAHVKKTLGECTPDTEVEPKTAIIVDVGLTVLSLLLLSLGDLSEVLTPTLPSPEPVLFTGEGPSQNPKNYD